MPQFPPTAAAETDGGLGLTGICKKLIATNAPHFTFDEFPYLYANILKLDDFGLKSYSSTTFGGLRKSLFGSEEV